MDRNIVAATLCGVALVASLVGCAGQVQTDDSQQPVAIGQDDKVEDVADVEAPAEEPVEQAEMVVTASSPSATSRRRRTSRAPRASRLRTARTSQSPRRASTC